MSYFKKVMSGLASLLTGMRITVREAFKKPVTYKYPHEEPPLSPNYRSAIKLIRFDETNSHDCVACLACQRICPSFCIDIEGGKVDGIKKKRASKFDMDFALCSLCGLCIDVCPTTTLEYSKLYDEAGYGRDWNFDLLEAFKDYEAQFVDEQKAREAKAAEEKKQKAATAKAAKAAKAKKAAEAKAAAEAKKAVEAEKAAEVDSPAAQAAPVSVPADKASTEEAGA